jgi:hypothetical protein
VVARISAKRRALTAGQVAQQHGGQAAPAGWRNDAIAVVVGVVAWFVFGKYLHPLLIGVRPDCIRPASLVLVLTRILSTNRFPLRRNAL